MGDDFKKGFDRELRGVRWDQFLDRAWVYGAALGLVVLILFSKIIILSEVVPD